MPRSKASRASTITGSSKRFQSITSGHHNIHHRYTWQCVSLSYPLIKIVNGFAIFSCIRGTLETIDVLGIMITILGIDYEDVHLPPNEKLLNSQTWIVAQNYFLHNREILIITLGIAIVIFALEVPMAVFLYRVAKRRSIRKCTIWLQCSGFLLVLNVLVLLAMLIYSDKAGVIRDDLTASRSGCQFFVYSCVIRAGLFDFIKSAEMLFVRAFIRELKRKREREEI